MSARKAPWYWSDTNPNPTGGCLCFTANNPDQPKLGGWINPAREFNDLGSGSPHVFECKGCRAEDAPESSREPDVIEGTAIEIEDPEPFAPVNPYLPPDFLKVLENQGAGVLGKEDV